MAMRAVKAAAVQLSPVLYSREGTVDKIVRKIALKTCHVVMLDLPFKVADVIADAAGEK
jgi:hypothetical protein